MRYRKNRWTKEYKLDLKELTYIITIADTGNISRAAEKLYMAQSSLSQALGVYERELGIPLFMRTSRGVRPTPSGEAFIAHARQILQQYHLALNEAWDIEALKGGTVELGISSIRGTYLLPPVLQKFHQRHPNVNVIIHELNSVDLEDHILKGLLDIALVVEPQSRVRATAEFLMREEVVLVTTQEHPVMKIAHPAQKPNGLMWVDLKDTMEFDYVLSPPDTVLGRIARREFRRFNLEPQGVNTQLTAAFAVALGKAGLGLAFSYKTGVGEEKNTRFLRIGKDGIFLELALIYPNGDYRSHATRALGKLFHEVYLENE
jgi:DNA-binding transcriptional LysR family regulator